MNAKRQSPARALEALIAAHTDLAKLALTILKDEALDAAAKAPLIAAARYGFEDLDLIQDEVPAYGLVDDLFVLGYGLDQLLAASEDAAARYGDRAAGGRPIRELLASMHDRFYGFWEYCRQKTEQFFFEVAETQKADPTLLPESIAGFEPEVAAVEAATAGVALEEPDVAQLLARFRAFNPKDLEG